MQSDGIRPIRLGHPLSPIDAYKGLNRTPLSTQCQRDRWGGNDDRRPIRDAQSKSWNQLAQDCGSALTEVVVQEESTTLTLDRHLIPDSTGTHSWARPRGILHT